MTTYILYIVIYIGGFISGMIYAAWSTYRSQQKAEMEKLLATLAGAAEKIIEKAKEEGKDA